jgi:hypothetical protein
MKQKMLYRSALFLLAVTMELASCTKEGPAGPAGVQGPQGPTGPTGPQGDTGVANMIYSPWVSGFSGTYSVWTVPQITQGVMDSAAVLVYAMSGNGAVFPLPYNFSGYSVFYACLVGYIQLSSYNIDLSYYSFRYVIIPPGVKAMTSHMNYQELVTLLHITP